ncbi:MAG: DUF3300 domain-containing protein [Proteobacteria bacterium]|nr:DUF3300 domain-containing protein [Pseudomonadota bacterium]
MYSHSLPATGAAGRRWLSSLQYTALGLAVALSLTACNKDGDTGAPAQSGAPAQPAPGPQPVAYQPPQPEVLYRMVAPIALYPDKLVAQVLAASTYPDQLSAAESWLGANPGLKPAELARAVNDQPWDPSVKSLTQFPNVLEQMASNLPWTTALGKAYYNDPADVMNAVQVMRGRAYHAGTLKSSNRMQVRVAAPPANPGYTPAPGVMAPMVPPVIQAPPQFIEIAPTAVDTVYVPQYDPTVVYGAPMPLYTSYSYAVAPPLAVGLLGFGTAIVVSEPAWHRPWGWHSWGMHWGEPGRRWHAGEPPPPPMARPAVVYNNTTYVSRSTTVVNNTINVGQPRPMPAANVQPQPFAPHPGALGAAAVGGAALAAGALAQRPQPQPFPPHGGPGQWQQQPPAGQPPHMAGMAPQAGPFRPPWQAGTQAPLGFAQQPSAPPGPDHAPAAEALAARQSGRNTVPLPRPQAQVQAQVQAAPVAPPQNTAAQNAPRPWMTPRDQAHMRNQAQPQPQPQLQPLSPQLSMQQRAQEQARQQQAVMAQQRAQEQARQQQAVMAQQRAQEQARQQQAAMAQQRAQEQARQQQAAMAQQRAQEQARQQQAAMAQQRAQEQARQQQMWQRQEMAQRQEMQRAQQFQQQQQQMAAARARESRPPERSGGAPGQHDGHWR